MVTGALSTLGGGLLLFGNPVGIAVGATLVVGVLMYEVWDNREAIGDTVSSVVEGAGRVLGDLF